MADDVIESDTDAPHCRACEGGWGHEVDMTDGFDCEFRCRECREVIVISAQDDYECCDHRYVGEDLWRAEYATDTWTCPECNGEYGAHESDCYISGYADADDFDEDDFDDESDD